MSGVVFILQTAILAANSGATEESKYYLISKY